MSQNPKLKSILNKYKIHPKKKLGQNFIFDFNILDKIINNILPIDKFLIIEIGPGPGGLTRSILKYRPREVILIEKDNIFKRGLEEIFTEFNDIKIKLILNDFLNLDINHLIKKNTKIISNLPYYISTQILLKILPINKRVKEIVFTFQKEVGDRIIAQPGSKEYSRLSVIVQSVCDVSIVQSLPASVFFPKPNVDSSVLKFTAKKNINIENFEALKEITKKSFNKRRKMIKNSLKDIENLSSHLGNLGIDENVRPEDISVKLYCELTNLIYKRPKV